MRKWRSARGAVSFGCVVWLAIAALAVYFGMKVIPVKVKTSAFQDFIQEEAGFGSIKSIQQIEGEVLARARELELPIRKDNLTIKRTREVITIEAHYEITLDFFGHPYVWKFDPVAERRIFNT